jgi:hypothetical protein
MSEAEARLVKALNSGEHIKLGHKAKVYAAAKVLLPASHNSEEDVSQELAVYLWQVQTKTNSGWNPARGQWSTWAWRVMKGLIGKWNRRKHMLIKEDPWAVEEEDYEIPVEESGESLIIARETADSILRTDWWEFDKQIELGELEAAARRQSGEEGV